MALRRNVAWQDDNITPASPGERLWDFFLQRGGSDFRDMLDRARANSPTAAAFAKMVNGQSCGGVRRRTVLAQACKHGEVEAVVILLEFGADVNLPDRLGCAPLQEACWAGKVEIARLLLAKGADLTIQDSRGCTALHYATGYYVETAARRYQLAVDSNLGARLALVRLLVQHGSSSNSSNKDGVVMSPIINIQNYADKDTALHCAAIVGNVEMGRVLLQHGADPSIHSRYGPTALHRAQAVRRRVDFMRLLLEHGADANVLDSCSGKTLLHNAIFAKEHQYVQVAELLLKHGADSTLQDGDGKVVLELACELGRTSYIYVLLRHMIGNGKIRFKTPTQQG